ncbi:MAG: 30S ribosomal protein S6 [Symbiobacteriaceae bacterium]|nr:30S ribosomal protein S6 [Symbiobacteriaceae bacterium]
MHPYELMFILHPATETEMQDTLIERLKTLVEQRGGTITEIRKWGKRRLAYEIADQREGIYILQNFTAEPHVVNELDRVLKITESVIRFMIVRTDS